MAINYYDTLEAGAIPYFDALFSESFGGEPAYIYFDYATTIPAIRTMQIQETSTRVIEFGFVHTGNYIPTCAYPKDPDGHMDYGIDWTNWLQSGETISEVEWEVSDSSITILDEDNSGNVYAVMLSDGLAGRVYTLTCRVTTNQDRIEDRSMFVICSER